MRNTPIVQITLLLVTSLASTASADTTSGDAEVPTEVPGASFSYELRAQVFSPSYRWSDVDALGYPYNIAAKSLYFSSGLGLRVVHRSGHAFFVDGDYRFDSDVDGWFGHEDEYRVRFGTAHAGYGYRHVADRRRPNGRIRVWTITPNGTLSAGVATTDRSAYREAIPSHSPVVGARVGVDLDLHLSRFFFSWSFSYEYLHHTRGSLTHSNFLAWNVIPVFRMGVNLGRRVR
ncbi:MAG: hypothetical protein AAF500_15705 [Myxococcota bacterium]